MKSTRLRMLPLTLAASLLLTGPGAAGWAQTVGAAAGRAASAAGLSAAAGAQVLSLPPASVTPLAQIGSPELAPLSNPFPLSLPVALRAPAAQTALPAAAIAAPAAGLANAAAAVDRHPVIELLNHLQRSGVALPETMDSPADAAKLRAAAEALPPGAVRESLVRVATALDAPPGLARQFAIDQLFENGLRPAVPTAETPAPGFWEKLGRFRFAPARLKRYAAEKAEARRVKAEPTPPQTFQVKLERLRWTPDAQTLEKAAQTPAPDKPIVGQDLALEALEFGLRMPGDGHNVIITGAEGSGRETAARHILSRLAPGMPTPPDLVAVTNFGQKERPLILELPTGAAPVLKLGLAALLKEFKKNLPALLANGEGAAQKKALHDEYEAAAKREQASFQERVAQVRLVDGKFGIAAQPQPDQEGNVRLVLAPTFNGKPLSEEEKGAHVQAGDFTEQEWDRLMQELRPAAQKLLDQYMQLAQATAEAHARVHARMAAIDAETAANAVAAMGEPLKGALLPPAKHDDAAHAAWEQRAKQLMADFQRTNGSKEVAPFLAVMRLAQTPMGPMPMPSLSKDGQPVTAAQLKGMLESGELGAERWREIQQGLKAFVMQYRQGLAQVSRQIEAEHEALHKNDPPPTEAQAKTLTYLDQLLSRIASDYQSFLPQQPQEGNPLAALMAAKRGDPAEAYQVSVLASNEPGAGAPVIFEKAPTFENLFGAVEDDKSMMMMGGAMVKADAPGGPALKSGSFIKANGGFLVLNLLDVLREQGSWQALMRAVRTGQAEIAEGGVMGLLVGRSEKRHAVAAKVKIVLIGSPSLKMLLDEHDTDFAQHFKAESQFESAMDVAVGSIAGYLQFIRRMAESSTTGVLKLTDDAMIEVLQYGAKLSGSNEKLTTKFKPILDLLSEASYWARQAGRDEVARADVAEAIQKRLDFEGRLRRRMQEGYWKDTFHVQTEGTAVGQTNALTVYGDFGLPTRVTVALKAGGSGVTALDQEAGLAGPFYKQGVQVLESFLDHVFGQKKGLPFEVRVKKEQLYSQIDGDSSTSTNIYASLSALSGVPIKQSIAITGSADQFGNVQPIGGVNYKVEGFFDVLQAKLKAAGKQLDGTQGVIIPATNVPDLMLRQDIVDAVKAGKFHVWAVTHVSQGIEILTGEAYSEIVRKINIRAEQVRRGGGAAKQ